MRWMQKLSVVLALAVSACAMMPALDPPRVSVADIRAVSVEGLELRMLLELRVQNPNGLAIDYDGVDVKLDLQGRTVATGVSAEHGSVPAYGESVVALPVRVSMVNLGRQALRMFGNGTPERVHYALEGKLGSPLFGATRFHSEGDLSLPGE
ncbi:MAG TPA: LEA type 2 family protein [Usitatibacter sp.]|nr:LEA type 2 family protein [Usitatibacter sp.]